MYLGFAINVLDKTVKYKIPVESWEFRSHRSAGTPARNLSGMMSRISLIKKYTWPPQDAGDTVRELTTVYTNRGHILSPKTKTKAIP
jgi:hypothetical protein